MSMSAYAEFEINNTKLYVYIGNAAIDESYFLESVAMYEEYLDNLDKVLELTDKLYDRLTDLSIVDVSQIKLLDLPVIIKAIDMLYSSEWIFEGAVSLMGILFYIRNKDCYKRIVSELDLPEDDIIIL